MDPLFPTRSEALRRWSTRSAWRPFWIVAALGLVGGTALLLGLMGPFWAQILSGLVFVVLGVVVIEWTQIHTWVRGIVALLYFGPTMCGVAVVGSMLDRAFEQDTERAVARLVAPVPSSSVTCYAAYAYEVDGETYRTMAATGDVGCPQILSVEYIVAEPWRARPSRIPPPGPPPE